jgi:ribonuclease H / adenosylcobalamin/alpha-ribazole phosphatase
MPARWPKTLWIIRHGESAGNVASAIAEREGSERFRLDMRDADVPLSQRGEQQALALGQWFAARSDQAKPDTILVSPYVRARQTAQGFLKAGGCSYNTPILIDKRLREKECGILDGLTPDGIAAYHPDQSMQRKLLGKFYHRPPRGENWCDVIQRLRALIDRITLHHADQNIMVIAHEVIVFCMRYIIENLDEAAILAIDAQGDVANCAITEYHLIGDILNLVRWAETEAIEMQGAEITLSRDSIVAARG